jgi:peptidoglycan/LPS O-acetylase OafA/YrhL
MQRRILELDGIRALAVIGVLYTHFANEDSYLGHLGVRVFFVLSAFLITGLLIDARDAPKFEFFPAIRAFYIHRILRIVPTCYLMIITVTFLDGAIGRKFIYHLLFLSNFWFAIHQIWQPWQFSALWTLSVEWQFYLIWPIIVLNSSNRAVFIWALVSIVIAVVFWVALIIMRAGPNFPLLLPPASLDALAAGVMSRLFYDKLKRPTRIQIAIAIATAGTATILNFDPRDFEEVRYVLFEKFLIDILSLYPISILIASTAARSSFVLQRVLGFSPLVWLGRMSYGVYLYHVPMLWAAYSFTTAYYGFTLGPSLSRMASVTLMTVIAAYLSWLLIERPLQRYGRKLTYGSQAPITANIST